MSTSCRRSVSFISVLLPLASSYICVRSITGVLPCVVHQCRSSVSFISVLLPLASSNICVRNITGVLPCVMHQCRTSVSFINVSCSSRQLIYRCTHHYMHVTLCRASASFINVSFLFCKLVYMCTQHNMSNDFMAYISVIHQCVVLLLPIYIHIYICIHNTVCILPCVVH